MQTLLSISEARPKGCDDFVLKAAAANDQQILLIRWEEDYGISVTDRLYGFTQWSRRPYYLGQGCDGTTNPPIHLLARHFCAKLHLSYDDAYRKSYPDEGMWTPTAAERNDPDCLVREWPEPNDQVLRLLLRDLGAINNSSLLSVLEDEFTNLGFDVAKWWNR